MNKTLTILASIIAVILVGTFFIPKSTIAPTVIQNPINTPINQQPVNNSPVVNEPPVKNEPVVCTMEAKECPDGSYVSRTGPKCEFAMCPSVASGEAKVAYIDQRILNNGVYITPLEVTEDSRCPPDVQCIWAGTVKLRTKLEIGASSEEVILNLDTPIKFKNKEITLIEVSPVFVPSPTAKPGKPYFTFRVK